jgi:hypothetical protein
LKCPHQSKLEMSGCSFPFPGRARAPRDASRDGHAGDQPANDNSAVRRNLLQPSRAMNAKLRVEADHLGFESAPAAILVTLRPPRTSGGKRS